MAALTSPNRADLEDKKINDLQLIPGKNLSLGESPLMKITGLA